MFDRQHHEYFLQWSVMHEHVLQFALLMKSCTIDMKVEWEWGTVCDDGCMEFD